MRRMVIALLLAGVLAVPVIAANSPARAAGAGVGPVTIGAVYPTGGPQAAGGEEEFIGVRLAAEYVNRRGGAGGRSIRVLLEPANSYDAAPGAVERLAAAGATVIVGSYGSTISGPAAQTAARLGIVFWETGAVGQLGMEAAGSDRVFRFAPSGAVLGRAAVTFVRDVLTPRMARPISLRYAVAYVDDDYGRAVAAGATDAVRASRLPLAAELPYALATVNFDVMARQIERARANVVVVAAYLPDGVAIRRALLRNHVPLVANVGTSSSYCHPAFGDRLGTDAVGVFASDKPDARALNPDHLSQDAAAALRWARDQYLRLHGKPLGAAGLSGFAGGLALFGYVLPRAESLTPDAIARAARAVRLPTGSLPDGSGLAFAPPGTPVAGANLEAQHVIWEWIRPRTRAIVWPQTYATHPIVFP